ncbi:MAG: DUF7117 family protein [Halobacteriota archaeon]
MKVRGERECTECGTRWSYFETGSVGCPACGSLRSVGTTDREVHTDGPATFDLTGVRAEIDGLSDAELASNARTAAREYVRSRGFVRGGELLPLDETYLAAVELMHVGDYLARQRRPTEDESLYFLALLRDADDGKRPPAAAVPKSAREARGIATADAIRAYRRDVRTWLDAGNEVPARGRSALERLSDHETRFRMLEGNVDPETADTLLEATRALADGLRGDEKRLRDALNALERLE